MSKRAEIKNDYYNSDDNVIHIDAWKTSNPDEEGKTIAKIDIVTHLVKYIDEDARNDIYAQGMIEEAIAKL